MRGLQSLSAAVVAKLPDCVNIQKQIQIDRQKNLPQNPIRIQDLAEIPDIYNKTLAGEPL